jgi:hypothetical protein
MLAHRNALIGAECASAVATVDIKQKKSFAVGQESAGGAHSLAVKDVLVQSLEENRLASDLNVQGSPGLTASAPARELQVIKKSLSWKDVLTVEEPVHSPVLRRQSAPVDELQSIKRSLSWSGILRTCSAPKEGAPFAGAISPGGSSWSKERALQLREERLSRLMDRQITETEQTRQRRRPPSVEIWAPLRNALDTLVVSPLRDIAVSLTMSPSNDGAPTVVPARAGEQDVPADEASSAETPNASDPAWRAEDGLQPPRFLFV